ncbi:MAG: glycosyltransferase family 2 protein [bacterium]|nr:glycosyltransferase family 2 protein [bacterium]
MKKISVALATFNEEENLRKCLESVRQLADEIVVVDGTSSDKTVEIAKKFGAKIILTDNPPIFHINKQKAIEASSGDWILQLDADEVVDENLKNEILKIVEKGSSFSAFWIKRKNYFLGKWLKKGGQYPDPVIRFFKNGQAYLPCKSVHEQMVTKGEVGWLENDLLHYSVPSFSRYLINSNRYTSLTTQEFKANKISCSLLNFINYIFFKPIWTFGQIFFRHKGFRDGFPGFVFALFSSLHFSISYIKYWEIIKNES